MSVLRFGGRSLAFVGTTAVHWTRLSAALATKPAGEHQALKNYWAGRWARRLLEIYQVHVQPNGLHVGLGNRYPGRSPNGTGRLFMLNHRSGLDVGITLSYFNASLVSRADLANWPMIGYVARGTGTLFVERGNSRSGAAVVKAMSRALGQGRGVAIYPEGTAYSGDEVRTLFLGGFRAAAEAGAEIVPAGIAYADAETTFGDEGFLEHMRRIAGMKRVDVALEVGEPIPAAGLSTAELRKVTKQRMQALVTRARARLG